MCGQRRIQDEEAPWRSRKRESILRKTVPSVFPLPMSPGYATASNWKALAVSYRRRCRFLTTHHRALLLFQGNMKQHMLTHKIRDMPQHMFDKPPTSEEVPPPPPLPPHREIPTSEPDQSLPPPTPEPPKEQPVKRAPTESELPLPKRPPSKLTVFWSSARQYVHNTK